MRVKILFSAVKHPLYFFKARSILFLLIFILHTIVIHSANAEIKNSLNQIPDNQTLILKPKIDNYIYDENIYALKKEGSIYLSLIDVIDVLGLAINYDEESQIGRGWFFREDWKIDIDLNRSEILSKNEPYFLKDKDQEIDNGIIFIKKNILEKVLDIQFDVDISGQYLNIDSAYPLPALAKHKRLNGDQYSSASQSLPKLPRHPIETEWFDINTANIRAGVQYRHEESGSPSYKQSTVVAVEGQVAHHEAYGLVNYNNNDNIQSAIGRLSKHSEEANLLGPMQASYYSLGDTTLTDIPLLGSASQELGFRASNKKTNSIDYRNAVINGDAIPGWDIELYRNDILVQTQIVSQEGRYDFQDVQLLAGNNDFEIFFYGPQGEIRNKRVNIPVSAESLRAQNNVYDVSLSLSETQSYSKNQRESEDQGSVNLSAKYQKLVGNSLVYTGARSVQVEGKRKLFGGAGFSSIVHNTLVDGRFGADEKGEVAGEISTRRKILGWDSSLTLNAQSEGYAPDGNSNPSLLKVSSATQGNFKPTDKTRLNVFSRSFYSQNANKSSQIDNQAGIGYQIGRYNLSNVLRYNVNQPDEGMILKQMDNNFALRANLGPFFIRGGLDYNILPEYEIDNVFTQVNYRTTSNFSSDLRLKHNLMRDQSEARLNLNFTNKYFRTSPFIEYNSDHDLYAGININLNLIDDPKSGDYVVTSRPVMGRGLVSAFIYYDKNGNEIYDGDDEPLPDVVLESVNIRRRTATNEEGYSLISDLPTSRVTDIKVDETTLPDSFMISGFEGVSILPQAGEIVELEFPIHMSGEMDGTVVVKSKDGGIQSARRAVLNFYPLDQNDKKPIAVQTATDGFYVATKIPPGQYLVSLDPKTSRKLKAALPAPKIIEIGYNGDTIYGENIELKEGEINVPVQVSYSADIPEVTYVMRTASQKRSKLLTLLGKMKEKQGSIQVSSVYSDLQEISWQSSEVSEYKRFQTSDNDINAAYAKCHELSRSAIPCTLEVYVPIISASSSL